jgi:hypothetical protein
VCDEANLHKLTVPDELDLELALELLKNAFHAHRRR